LITSFNHSLSGDFHEASTSYLKPVEKLVIHSHTTDR